MWSGRFLRDIWKRFTHKILNHLSDRIPFPGFCPCCQPQMIENLKGGVYSRLVHFHLLCPDSLSTKNQNFYVSRFKIPEPGLGIEEYLFPPTCFGGLSLFIPTWSCRQTKGGGLFFSGCNLSIIMAGMERVVSLPALVPTSEMTSLPVIQSDPQSGLSGAARVTALVFFFFSFAVLLQFALLPSPSLLS